MSSPHHKPSLQDALRLKLIVKEGDKWTIKPRALEIIWGGDSRYWLIPPEANPEKPVELLQVSWLEVTGSLDLDKLEKGGEYKVSFTLKLKPDAFGWGESPVYFMAKPGKAAYIWRKVDLSRCKPGAGGFFKVPEDPVLKFTVPAEVSNGEKLKFGMYEIWKGRWKGGLVIQDVVIERA